jgi:hypothetical protein
LLPGGPAALPNVQKQLTLAQQLVLNGMPYVTVAFFGGVAANGDSVTNDSHYYNQKCIYDIWHDTTDYALTQLAKNLQASGKRVLILMGGEFGRGPADILSYPDGRGHYSLAFTWAILSINQPKFITTAVGDTGPDGLNNLYGYTYNGYAGYNFNAGALVDPIKPGTLGALMYKGMGFNVGTDTQTNIPAVLGTVPPVDYTYATVDAPKLMGHFGLA